MMFSCMTTKRLVLERPIQSPPQSPQHVGALSVPQRGWAQSLKKLIYCQVVLFQFEEAFDNLRLLEEYLTSKRTKKSSATITDLRRTHELMGEVNYQIFKFPTLADYTSRLSCTNGCGCTDDRANINVTNWIPKKPVNGSKMSGHRMAYA